MALATCASIAAKPAEAPAKLRVDGAGLLRDRELRLALERLLAIEDKPLLDANAMEDAAVILTSALGEEGFQNPRLEIEATLADGSRKQLVFDPTFANPLPRPLQAREVRFRLTPGVRSHIQSVEFRGLTAVPPREARSFFRTGATLIGTARTNAYSPSRVTRAADALLDELRRRGYTESEVRAEKPPGQEGPLTVRVEVREGTPWRVSTVRYQRDEGGVVLPSVVGWLGRPWSSSLQEDIREAVRRAYYVEGFPDVGVHVAAEPEEAAGGFRETEVTVTIVPGTLVRVGNVRFEGNVTTRPGVLRRRVRLDSGDPLDVVALERARYRISRLGVFESVDRRLEPEEGAVRDPVFVVREGARYETNLLFGYGSYEQFRGGVEHRQMNIFGLAHQSRLELVQSMKSTSADYTYALPELFGESLDGTVKLFGLQRDEIAFVRQEYGLNASIKRAVRPIGGDFTAGYTFQALRNRRNELSTQATDERQVNVASMTVTLTGDRRDSPLRPRHGYHWSAQFEAADPKLGGEVTYQRFELAGSYHTRWGEGRWVHVGLSQGLITTVGADDRGLPVNKRFYPGGDNSIRGFQRGEAAPRGADGLFIGAKSYALFNVELEQALTPNWSVVALGDALGAAVSLRDFPIKERLYSAGVGVRYQTLIGPLRLEYGRNLNPRADDPSGTWHFSIGYPF
jgi:outer membrane protein insertion porin family